MRGWGQEFHANAYSPVATFPEIHDSAFLLFLGFRVYQNKYFAVVHLVSEDQKASVGTDHQSFTDLPKLAALMAAAKRLQPHLVEDALAATGACLEDFAHGVIMGLRTKPVNCPFGQVLLTGQAGLRIPQLVRGSCWP